MAEREPYDDEKLKALLQAEIRAAINYDSQELSGNRAAAIDYYEGTMNDTPYLPGRSRMVSRDVADTIGLMLPGVIRTFIASGRMVDYQPVGMEDEKFADTASDYVNHVFMKENQGFRILWDASHDSLLLGNGIVKHYWDASPSCEYDVMTGKTEEELAVLMADKNVEIVAQTEGEPLMQQQLDPQTGATMAVMVPTYDVKIKREDKTGHLCIECIEPENFLMNQSARFIEEARFTAHRDTKSRSELIEMGFDADVVNALPSYNSFGTTESAIARNRQTWEAEIADESMREIELFECYCKVDIDGDGKAEMVRAYIAGQGGTGELLSWEEWEDECPFSDIPCEPRPHRWDAKSITDETKDIQRVKTVLTRQLLDNMYAVAMPMVEAEVESVINPEMLTSPKFGGIIWRKKSAQPTVPHVVPFIGDKILAGLEYMDQMIEKRTGVSRSTMALDPEALTNQTATASQLAHDAAYSQTELIARNMAELGWTRVFRQILKLIVKHQTTPRILRLKPKAEPVKIDPSVWNVDMDVTVNVGLGTGSRDRDMAMLQGVLMNQMGLADRFAQGGFVDKAIEMLPEITMTMRRIAESAGLQNADEYYPEVTEQDVQQMIQAAQNRPDPEMQKEMAKAQATAQLKQAELQQEAALKQLEMEKEANKEMAQMQADLQVKHAEMEKDTTLQREKAVFDAAEGEKERQLKWNIALLQANTQREQHREQMANENAKTDKELSNSNVEAEKEREFKGKSEKRAQRAKQNELLIQNGKEPQPEQPEGVAPDAILGQMSELVAQLGKAMHAPKRIVRGKDGRAVGVESVQ